MRRTLPQPQDAPFDKPGTCGMTRLARGRFGGFGAAMKAIRFHEFGGPEVLRYEDVPDPVPRKDQVLVRVKACAMNHLDVWVRKGLPGVKLPHIPGSDVAGEIVEVGEYVTGFKPGQRVLLAPMHFCGRCEH